MNRNLKSIQYAFIANGFQVFNSDNDDNCFILSRLVCFDCGEPWYTNLTECFLCKTINPYLFRCSSCGKYQSITKSNNASCSCGGKLYMMCPNQNCISNKNINLLNEINNYGGVFNKNSGMQISQQYCYNCGGHLHFYKTYKLKFMATNNPEKINLLELSYNFDGDYILIRADIKSEMKYKLLKPIAVKSNNEKWNTFQEILKELS